MSARQILLNLLGSECSICGAVENLQFHHKDGDRTNNDLLNITILCKICHDKKHGFRNEEGTPIVKVKAVRIGNSLRMTIPKQIADYLKINPGDDLEVTVQDSEMVVKKK